MKKMTRNIVVCLIVLISIGRSHGQEVPKIILSGDLVKIESMLKKDPGLVNRVTGSFGWTPLLHAVASRNLETVKLLVRYGADLNRKSKTNRSPLSYAVTINSKDVLNFLLQKGAEVPATGAVAERMVHRAARGGHQHLITRMIQAGIDLKIRDASGNGLLHSAAIGGLDRIVAELIKKGIDPNRMNHYGIMPLHLASIRGHKAVLKILIANGAEIDCETPFGKRGIHLAMEKGHSEVVTFLQSRGSDAKPFQFPILKGSYLGQKRPGKKAELFAPGIISGMTEEHGAPVFSSDGSTIFWTRRRLVSNAANIYWMRRVNGVWQKPEKLPLEVGYVNANPSISPDGALLCYSNNAPETGSGSPVDMNIWFIRREGGRWQKSFRAGSVLNTSFYEGGSYMAADGSLYFISNREGGFGSLDIYHSAFTDGKYRMPVNMGKAINSKYFDAYPFVSPKGDYLIFESYRPGAAGGGDLFISFKEDGSWSDPKPMGERINRPESRETFPMLSPDGKYFFFSSDRKGNLDSYWIDASVIDELR